MIVVRSAPTETAIPGDVSSFAVPVPSASPVQSAVAKRRTTDPPSALPRTAGDVLLAGEAGSVDDRTGAAGAVESDV
jgi:hypothetical protein